MLLATTTVEDFDRFETIFSTKGAEKRRQHGSRGAQVFRDPNEQDRVSVAMRKSPPWLADADEAVAPAPPAPSDLRATP